MSTDKDALRITDQFHVKLGTVYDLKCHGDTLTVFISPRESPEDSGAWRVDASSGSKKETLVTEWGDTRTDAVRAAGKSWALNAGALNLPAFDWEAVVRVLESVRAL